MRHSRNWWMAVLVPVLVIGGIEVLADWVLDPFLPFPVDTAVVVLAVFVLAVAFVTLASRRIGLLSGELETRSRELERRGSTARALHQLGVTVAGTRDPSAVQQVVVDSTRRLLEADVAFVLRPGPDAPQVVARAGPADAFLPHPEEGGAEPADALGPAYRRSVVAAPLRSRASTIGSLVVAGRSERTFSVDELETLSSLANLLALAIENARLEAQLREVAVRAERERIAGEMHDGLAQVLGYVNTKSQAVEELLKIHRIDEARSQLGELAAAARSIYVDVREAILGLTSPIAPERGLVGAVEEYAARFAESAKLAVRVEASPAAGEVELTPEVQAQAFRIVQESLTNVRKHANAARVVIALAIAGGELRVEVTDDGRGMGGPARREGAAFDDAWPRYGLAGMRQRADAIGGRLEMGAASGGGTSIVLHLPLPAAGVGVAR